MRDFKVNVNNVNFQVREYEQAGKPAVIFLHFGSGNLMMWEAVAPYFQNDYHLVMPDLRGHGRSDKPLKGYHIDEMAADIIGIMEHMGVDQAHVIGSSMGAEVGLSVAANYPEKVASLVCDGALESEFGPYSLWEGSETEAEEELKRRQAEVRAKPEAVFPTPEALIAASQQTFEKYGWWNEAFKAVKLYNICEIENQGGYTANWRKWVADEYMTYYFEYRFEDYYRRVKCPILMLPPEDAKENERQMKVAKGLCNLASQCQIVHVPGAVYPYGWLLIPEAMSKAVLEFLAAVRKA